MYNFYLFYLAESLILSAGERFSFVVEANQIEGCYWVRFRGTGDCGETKSSVHEEAYLCYEGYDQRPNGTITYEDGRRSGVVRLFFNFIKLIWIIGTLKVLFLNTNKYEWLKYKQKC